MRIFPIFILLVYFLSFNGSTPLSAQSSALPKAINYQAVARNNNGTPILNRNITVQFSILQGSINGASVYTERHQAATGNLGLFTLEIGNGNPVFGSWTTVDWKGSPKFLKVEIDPNGGTNFVLLGTSSFLSVPYALVAENAINGDGWGNQTVQTDNSLTGQGTMDLPLRLSGQSATQGQVLKWNGSAWVPGNDDISFQGTLVTSPRISGNGTANSPLDIAGMGASTGQVLKWNGSAWSPGDASGAPTIKADSPLSVRTLGNETILGIMPANTEGSVLMWSNGQWNVRNLPTQNLVAGNGIEITNNQVHSTTWRVNNNNDVHRLTGRVGIGTDNPSVKLDIHANSLPDSPHLRLFETETDFSRMSFEHQNSREAFDIVGRPEGGGSRGRLNFYYTKNDQDIMSLTDEGIVGIGTVDPENTTKIDVVSRNKYAGLFSSDWLDESTTVVNAFFDNSGNVDAVAVAGTCEASPGKGFGGQFYGGNVGVLGTSYAGNFGGNYAAIGVYGESNGTRNGTRIGVYGFGKGGEYNMGVYGGHNGQGRVNWAGFFEGDINVTGFVRKSGGTFVIDHPLDPENKLLYHSFVESPDMMNIYNGNATTDSTGTAVVELPSYFEALNKDFRYQLTAIGQNADAWIQEEVANNRFVIRSNIPNLKISWQVTGIRKDPFAEQNRIIPEVNKEGSDKGKYLHPEVYGLPAEKYMFAGFKPSEIRRPELPKRNYENNSMNRSRTVNIRK